MENDADRLQDYVALTRKVDGACRDASASAGDALACARGCDACCQVWLTVSDVEAEAIRRHIATMPESARSELSSRGLEQGKLQRRGGGSPRCAMLDSEGACGIYAARPMVCRTQGLALQFRKGTLDKKTVRWRSDDADKELVACPLNYTERPPAAAEIIDSDLLNTLLGVVNLRHTEATRGDPKSRTALITLATEGRVIA